MAHKSLIKLEHVSKRYDNVLAVDDLSLGIRQGEILVLLGHSGCGKTSTLRLIAGLERPDAGLIWLNGETVAGANTWVAPEKRQVGMVFQDYALLPHMTVRENITFGLRGWQKRAQVARVQEMLALVGMPATQDRYPHQLSGGQQQRIALARALAAQPAILLLDEPFSNLDAARRKSMRDEVRAIIKAVDATALFVTHDQEEALHIGDRIAIMHEGQILQLGQPDELYHLPQTQAIGEFLGEANWLAGRAMQDSVDTELGELALARPDEGDVMVMIRPELVDVVPQDDGEAVVTDVRFYGHYKMLYLRLNGDQQMMARVWSDERLAPGERVTVHVKKPVITFPARNRG